MIQRIQTLYLFLTGALMGVMAFVPLGHMVAGGETYTMTAFTFASEHGASSIWQLGLIISVAALLPFTTLFLFRKRQIQFRLCMAEYALLLGAQAMALLYFYRLSNAFPVHLGEVENILAPPMFLPVVGIILNWLALRGIKKDIMLLKSMDRIR